MTKRRLTREQILQAQDLRTETIDVPEWGGELVIRALTMQQLYDIKESSFSGGENRPLRGTILTFCAGVAEPTFTLADYDELKKKSAAVEKVVGKILKLSGIGTNALDDAIKNSEPT